MMPLPLPWTVVPFPPPTCFVGDMRAGNGSHRARRWRNIQDRDVGRIHAIGTLHFDNMGTLMWSDVRTTELHDAFGVYPLQNLISTNAWNYEKTWNQKQRKQSSCLHGIPR